MLLDAHNYETYFLLYADGELDAKEMQQVEAFVVKHPELGAELVLFLDARLEVTSHTHMPAKHLLLKALPWDADNLTTEQHHMLLQLDGELPSTQAEALSQLVATDAQANCDWNSLSVAQLDAGLLEEMPDKHLLYRQATKVRPMRRWQPLAAAAAVVGVGWFVLMQLGTGAPAADTHMANTEVNTTAPSAPKFEPRPAYTTPVEAVNGQAAAQPSNATAAASRLPKASGQVGVPAQSTNDKSKIGQTVAQQQAQDDNQQTTTTVALATGADALNAVNSVAKNNASTEVSNQLPTTAPIQIETAGVASNSLVASPALYNEEPGGEPEYIYISGGRIEKQKLRGVFRKVGRTIGRTLERHSIAQVITDKGSQR
ncbi:MAG: hypothetical protein EAY75_09385 [Bacteroidetes bacterium]|nr:MAG: hypothetical protein EAY75_09385 [Bacteroidota bacterium]